MNTHVFLSFFAIEKLPFRSSASLGRIFRPLRKCKLKESFDHANMLPSSHEHIQIWALFGSFFSSLLFGHVQLAISSRLIKKDFFCHFLLSNYFLLTLVKQNVFSTLWNNIKIWYLNILLVSIIFNLVYIYGKLLIRVIRWKPDITTNHGFSTEKNKLSKKFFLIFFKNLIFAVLAASTLLYLATLSKKKRNQQPFIILVIV